MNTQKLSNILSFFRPVVNITPMVASNFEELVLQQERGVRVLVLFVDDPSKMKLIKQFAAAVTPFSRLVGRGFVLSSRQGVKRL